ncbi:DUF551 domain-containing protein [Cronobacter sakazakii]
MSELNELIASEIADFFAGFGGPGEPDIQSGEAQRLLTERVLSVLALRERAEPVAEVVSKFGDPEAFGERELRILADIQKMPYGTKFFASAPPAPVTAGWIACSERMPDDGVSVLAYCKCGDNFSGIYTMRAPVIRSKNSRKDDSVVHHERVTHWMPLPAAPGKEG